jgi:isopropylmalate/homocitrate/citramalate synthase
MEGAEQVVADIDRPEGVRIAGLALNAKGVARALEAKVDEIRYAVTASETFNQKNQGASVAETLAELESIADQVKSSGKLFSAVISTSFGCPFEGEIATSAVIDIGHRLEPDRCRRSSTRRYYRLRCAQPGQRTRDRVAGSVGSIDRYWMPFPQHPQHGIANAVAAIESGVRILDASVGGIGGCPFAPRATGNIATEDLCYLLRNMGYETGIDLAGLVDVAKWVEQYFDQPLPGQVMKAGLFPDDVLAERVA